MPHEIENKNPMPVREIPKQEWTRFFDMFSGRHEGWRVTVRIFSGYTGSCLEAREMLSMGITADMKNRNRHEARDAGRSAAMTQTRESPTDSHPLVQTPPPIF